MSYIFVAFYTEGTRYAAEAARLRKSLDLLCLKHDIRGVPDLGSWQANTLYTATFIQQMMAEYTDRHIVYVDADAVVWNIPVLFDTLEGRYDFAVHYRAGHELLNGTLWIAQTKAARDLVQLWLDTNRDCPGTWDQKNLQAAINYSGGMGLRLFKLPPEYCLIFDIMVDDTDAEPVIEHLQASREVNEYEGSPYRRAREARLKELGE